MERNTSRTIDAPALSEAPAASIARLDRSALVAGAVACGLPLLAGIGAGWSGGRIAIHLVLGLIYFVLIQQNVQRTTQIGRWLCDRQPLYLALVGLLAMALLSVSGDYLIQPIAFTIPFVQGLLVYGPRIGAPLGGGYLALMGLGLWLGGQRTPGAIVFPLAVYGALMVFMAAFVRLAQDQQAARQQADTLAADLARERDALAALAAENARLAAQAGAAATLAERNRIARELHDTIAQGLTAVTLQLEAAQRAFERDPQRARARLVRAHELARDTLSDVRKSVWTLAEPSLNGATLQAALEAQVRRFAERSGLNARYEHSGAPATLSDEHARQVLRIVQEALTNVEKHANARTVVISSHCASDAFEVLVHDDGAGFTPNTQQPSEQGNGFGLTSMHERARLIGATLTIGSGADGGTTVQLRLRAE
jgi:signal transduction histidine kinase